MNDDGPRFFSNPEEAAAALREQQEQYVMHTQDNTHLINRLLQSLNEDELEALDLIILHSSNPMNVGYFRGQISMVQHLKYGHCVCGESHNPEDLLGPDMSPEVVIPDNKEDDDEIPYPVLGESGMTVSDWMAKLKEYNMEVENDRPEYSLRCIGCGTGSISLADRMVNPPGLDGCSGCQQKSKFG